MTNFNQNDSIHHFRTEIPNILLDLGLDTYSLRLYIEIKRIAGDHGNSFASNATLAERTKMSEAKLKECKQILAAPFPQLGDKPLITIQLRYKKDGSPDTSLITVEDLWPANMKYFLDKINSNKVSEGHNTAQGGPSHDPGVGHKVGEGGPPGGSKEEPIKKNHIKKSYVPTAIAGELAAELLSAIKKKKPDFKQPSSLTKWAEELDWMMNLDKRTPEQIRRVLAWLPTDHFWAKNILSAGKLREKFDQLELQMQAPQNQNTRSPQIQTQDGLNEIQSQYWNENMALIKEIEKRLPDKGARIKVYERNHMVSDRNDPGFDLIGYLSPPDFKRKIGQQFRILF